MTTPLLRWAGSKRKLLPNILPHLPTGITRYIEPFAGSACLFFALDPPEAILGDFNNELIDFYRIVRSQPQDLIAEIQTYPVTKDFYYALRATQSTDRAVEAAARFLYLNRYCFNGVYRTNKDGYFNVPYGSKTGPLPTEEQILIASQQLAKAELLAGDFLTTLSHARAGDFVYLDPPYSATRYRGEYGYGAFALPDVTRMRKAVEILDDAGAIFLLSYKSDPVIQEIFSHWHQKYVSVRRHISGFTKARGLVEEMLISNRPFTEERQACQLR